MTHNFFDPSTYQTRIAAESDLPQFVANHGDTWTVECFLLFREDPAECRLHAEEIEEVVGHR